MACDSSESNSNNTLHNYKTAPTFLPLFLLPHTCTCLLTTVIVITSLTDRKEPTNR